MHRGRQIDRETEVGETWRFMKSRNMLSADKSKHQATLHTPGKAWKSWGLSVSELSANKEIGTTAETLTHNVASQLELTGEHWAQSPPHFQDRHSHKAKQNQTHKQAKYSVQWIPCLWPRITNTRRLTNVVPPLFMVLTLTYKKNRSSWSYSRWNNQRSEVQKRKSERINTHI